MHDKRPDIQGLRAWAVIAVVIFHFFPTLLPYGFLGVDVFFVLSGFLITLVLEGRPACLSTYYNFYFKRLRRILPLAILIVLLCVIAISCLQQGSEFSDGMKSALYAVFFVKNLQPHKSLDDDYFEQLETANDFFTHYWSLCVEIQFYLLAPFVIHLLKPRTDNAHISFAFMTAISAGSFFVSQHFSPQETFDSTISRLWQFLIGAMAFHADLILAGHISLPDGDKSDSPANASRKTALLIPAVFAIISTIVAIISGDRENVLRLYTTFLTGLILACRSNTFLLCHESLQIVGDISYSLYLIHWPIVCVLDIFGVEDWQSKLLALIVSFVLAVISHYGYEKRYLTFSTKSTIFLVFALYIVTISAISSSAYLHQGLLEYTSATTPAPQKFIGGNQTLSQAEIDKINAQMTRENDLRYKDCKLRSGKKNPMGFCDLNNGTGHLHFLIMGNSYAANLGGLVQKHFSQHYGKLQSRAIAQCEPLIKTPKDRYCPDYPAALKIFNTDIEQQRPDVLFLIARFINPNVPVQSPIENDQIYQYMDSRLKYYEERVNKKVFILQAFPRPVRLNDLAKKKKKLGLPMMPYMPDGTDADAKPMKERVKKLAEKCTKCVIFDIESCFLNEAGNFTVLNPQKLEYFDPPHHLNILGRELIEPVFKKISNNFDHLLGSRYPENIIE